MKKSTGSVVLPKNIAEKRLAKHNVMKIRTSELNLDCKENVKPQEPFVSKFKLKTRSIETPGVVRTNPFNLPNRLRMFSKAKKKRKEKPEPFIMSEPVTICDVDSTFYKIIEGRPLRQFDDIKVYMKNIRDITLMKANTGYLKEQVIKIDASYANEEEKYQRVDRLVNETRHNFYRFVTKSYNKAAAVSEAAKKVEHELKNTLYDFETLCFNYVAVRNKLDVVTINFETLARYRNFLNTLSPETWKIENNQKCVEFNFDDIKTSNEPYYAYMLKLDMLHKIPLKLYFDRPKVLISIFDNIRHLCLTYMGIDVLMAKIVSSVIKQRDFLKAQVTEEINEMQDLVATYKSYVKYEEETERATKAKFEKILMKDFQNLYASYNVSKLYTCLQYTNTLLFGGPEDPKDSIVSLMLQLESNYIKLTSALDNLNQDVVKEATKDFFTKDLKKMRDAHKAQRSLKEFTMLSKALNASFEPPRRRQMKM